MEMIAPGPSVKVFLRFFLTMAFTVLTPAPYGWAWDMSETL